MLYCPGEIKLSVVLELVEADFVKCQREIPRLNWTLDPDM